MVEFCSRCYHPFLDKEEKTVINVKIKEHECVKCLCENCKNSFMTWYCNEISADTVKRIKENYFIEST